MCVCVRAGVRACVCVCALVLVCVRVGAGVRAGVRVCVLVCARESVHACVRMHVTGMCAARQAGGRMCAGVFMRVRPMLLCVRGSEQSLRVRVRTSGRARVRACERPCARSCAGELYDEMPHFEL